MHTRAYRAFASAQTSRAGEPGTLATVQASSSSASDSKTSTTRDIRDSRDTRRIAIMRDTRRKIIAWGRTPLVSERWTRRTVAALSLLGALVLLPGCSMLFPTEAGDTLSHFAARVPAKGEPAPPLHARRLNGEPIQFDPIVGERPVVVQLGSHSCPVYRYRRFDIAELQREFGDRVEFVVVYTQEAHPANTKSPYADEEWLTFANWITDTRVSQPRTMSERLERARWSTQRLERDDLVIVDAMDNATWRHYGAAPTAAFVIDTDGTVVLRQPWIEPEGIRRTLQRLVGPPS